MYVLHLCFDFLCSLKAISKHYPVLTEATFDDGVVGYIKRLSVDDAMSVFDELLGADLSNVSPQACQGV